MLEPPSASSSETSVAWLTEDTPEEVAALMLRRGWLDEGESVDRVERAGEGNMNVTLRVVIDGRAANTPGGGNTSGGGGDTSGGVILKQARPWVAKYPTIPAPVERAHVEHAWYRAVAELPGAELPGAAVGAKLPRLLGADDATYTLLLEDLGAASDLTSVYADGDLPDAVVDELAWFLRALHDAAPLLTLRDRLPDRVGVFANRAMRALNHAHIYEIPLRPDNGIELDRLEPGLGDAVNELRHDTAYRQHLDETGRAYLAEPDEAGVLLHGDFFPGSWLATGDGVRVIDPEFGFIGPAAFDVGVAVAHLVLAEREDLAERFVSAYEAAGADKGSGSLDRTAVARFAAAEVMRRLVGVAQLPLPEKPAGWRAGWLERSRAAMVDGDLSALQSSASG